MLFTRRRRKQHICYIRLCEHFRLFYIIVLYKTVGKFLTVNDSVLMVDLSLRLFIINTNCMVWRAERTQLN